MVKISILLIFLIIVSLISVSVSHIAKPPSNLTDENPSSSLSTRNKKPITAPIITPRQGHEFNSVSPFSSSQELSVTTEPELPTVQTTNLPLPPFLAGRDSPPPPDHNQSETTAISDHANEGGQNNSMVASASKPITLSAEPSPITTQQAEELTSLSPSQDVQSGTTEPELAAVQTIDFHVPPFPAERASPPPPDNQSETTAFSDHANPPPRLSPVHSQAHQSANNPIQRNPNQNPLFRMIPQNFEHQNLPISIPWCQRNALMENEGGQHPNEYHRMDRLSECVLSYFLMGGLNSTATWAERPKLSTSIYIQCFLNQVAFSLFLLAHLVFPRTNPPIAYIMDRVSFSLIVISGYLSTMPMYPPYIAIIMLLLVVMVYIFSRFRA